MIRDDRDGWMRNRQRRNRWIDNLKMTRLYERQYPTVYDCDEFQAATDEDTIRQILSGKIAYYGLGAEFEPTPDAAKGVAARRRDDEILINRLRDTWRALKR